VSILNHEGNILAFLALALVEFRAGFIVLDPSGAQRGPLFLGIELQQGAGRANEKRFDFAFVLLLCDHIKGEVLYLQFVAVPASPEP
jgi:hypothetical protein